jgi:hypothetical protein
VASFGLLWLIVAYSPVSNVLLPTGIVTAERTLFLPSVGVVLAGAVAALWLFETTERRGRAASSPPAGCSLRSASGRGVVRQRVWRNNDVLFDATVRDVPKSYRAHSLRGRNLALKQRLRESEAELRHAIRLFPYDAATVDVAEAYRRRLVHRRCRSTSGASRSTRPYTTAAWVTCTACPWRGAEGHWRAGLRGNALRLPRGREWLRNAVWVADSALGRPPRKRPPL